MNTMKNTQAQHSPLPWFTGKRFGGNRVSQLKIYSGNLLVAQASLMLTVEPDSDGHSPEANADLIVRACNSHADLVAALIEARDWLKYLGAFNPNRLPGSADRIDNAIAKANGEQAP
jgi:hypothetical protein